MNRPVWLFSMDSEQFFAPPTTTAALTAYFRKYGASASRTDIELVHFRDADELASWQELWRTQLRPRAEQALQSGLQPVVGFSFYTWNAAEFLDLAAALKADLPGLLSFAGGPHVQQAEDYLGVDPLDVIVLGEGEVTFQQLLDATGPQEWAQIDGIAYLHEGKIQRTPARARCQELDAYPSPLDVLELCDAQVQPLYESISYETSRGCPFRCAFCEWGTGAIGGKMYQWSMQRIREDWRKITAAGIKNLWLADSNFGALKQDREKAELIVELKQRTGLPLSFATSWSKKHSRQVQEIALLLHRHGLLPHYQLALQTLTPEALRLSNRQNMSSNEYQPIAKRMSEQGVPIAAELIWGLPGDNLPSFEQNLDQLLATFPNINIFGYTLLPGTEFYARREEYQIETIPVAGYGKAKGEYVVGCHSFDREQGEEGYFLITAHILLLQGHIMPLTIRWLALCTEVPISPLLRAVLRALLLTFAGQLKDLDSDDRMLVYERRNQLYLAALAAPERCFQAIASVLEQWMLDHAGDAAQVEDARRLLALDQSLCPRTGTETSICVEFDYDAARACRQLEAMEAPDRDCFTAGSRQLQIHHPGGVGDILLVADGGSWARGEILESVAQSVELVAIA